MNVGELIDLLSVLPDDISDHDDDRRTFSWRNPRQHIAYTNQHPVARYPDGNNVITYLDLGYDRLFKLGRFSLERDFERNNGYGWYVQRKDFVDWLNRPLKQPADNDEEVATLDELFR